MKRREFLKYGGAGLAVTTATTVPLSSAANACSVGQSCPTALGTISLRIDDKRIMMVDGRFFNFLAFKRTDVGSEDFRVPGPILRIREGDSVTISVRNDRPEAHGFNITGIPAATIDCIPAGETRCVTFTAPTAGTYLYYDGTRATREPTTSPALLYRVLGLHGALVVHPLISHTNAGSPTPYSKTTHTPAIVALFDALGTTERFQGGDPGGRWNGCTIDQEYSYQEKIWLLNQVDPKFNNLITATGITQSSVLLNIIGNFVPRYFTMNGRSGFDLASGGDVCPANYIGEPTLIRVINAGLCHHSTHIHGNHLMELAQADLTTGTVVVRDNILERDVWQTWPMQRRDMLLPFEVPPDIPFRDPVTQDGIALADAVAQEPFPLRYVMHCHTEMSQTAAGGNYPQGVVTHWEIEGPLGGRAQRINSAAL
ncbi:MAG: multicopper oxidase domain-containing protein [Hyphomicrobium sp.]